MGRTQDHADALMAATLAAYTTANVDPPARRFVSFARMEEEADSPTACAVEQLSVHVHSISGGLPGFGGDLPLAPRQTVRQIELGVRVSRCVPTVDDRGNPPTAERVGEASGVMADDMDALGVLAVAVVGGGVFGDCAGVTVGAVRNLGVAGDMHAVGFTVLAQY